MLPMCEQHWRRLAAVVATLAAGAACHGGSPSAAARAATEADARWMLEYYVAALQEQHHAAHGRFADDYSALFEPATRRLTSRALAVARPGFEVRVAAADSAGWSAAVSPRAFPGAVCVMTVGAPPRVLGVPTRTGVSIGSPSEVTCAGFVGRSPSS